MLLETYICFAVLLMILSIGFYYLIQWNLKMRWAIEDLWKRQESIETGHNNLVDLVEKGVTDNA